MFGKRKTRARGPVPGGALGERLEAAGVPQSWYRVPDSRTPPDEAVLVMEPSGDGWVAAIDERGARSSERRFASIDELADFACELLRPIVGDRLFSDDELATGLALRAERFAAYEQWQSANGPRSRDSMVQPGEIIDRFGSPVGSIFFPYQTPMEKRSQPPTFLIALGKDIGYDVFVVRKPFVVVESVAEAWFGQPGGGLRLWARPDESGWPRTVRSLVSEEFLEPVYGEKPAEPARKRK